MKIIERPESTTYVEETLFHYIKNETEGKNVLKDVKAEDIVIYAKIVDPNTFEPLLLFFVKNYQRDLINSLKYVTPLRYVAENDEMKEVFDPNKDYPLEEAHKAYERFK